MLRSALTATALLATLTSAREFGYTIVGGENNGDNDTYQQPIFAALRTPNVTHAVNFLRVDSGEYKTWGWTLNLTDVAVPNSKSQSGNYSEGHRIAATAWSLQPPGGASILSYLQSNSIPKMAYQGIVVDLPANVTAKYNSTGDAKQDCIALLGKQCFRSMQSHVNGDTSPAIGLSTLQLPGCEGTLSLGQSTFGGGTVIQANETYPYYSNTSIITVESAIGASGNLSHYQEAEAALQILTLSFSGQGVYEISVACQIIDYHATETSAAVSWKGTSSTSSGLLWGLVVLCVLAMMR